MPRDDFPVLQACDCMHGLGSFASLVFGTQTLVLARQNV